MRHAIMTTRPSLGWIRQDDRGRYSSTRFDNLALSAGATHAAAIANPHEKAIEGLEKLPKIGSNAHNLQEDWRNLLAIITRVDWMHGLRTAGTLSDAGWIMFAGLDVEHFHVELRSAFDYLAHIVVAHSSQPGQTPEKSYEALSSWVCDNRRRSERLFGLAITDLVATSRDFFSDRKRIRESIVHRGARGLVFPHDELVLFQLYGMGLQEGLLKGLEGMMFNEHLVDFKRYATETLLVFWELAEGVAVQCFSRFDLRQVGLGDGAMAYHPGLEILDTWATTSGGVDWS